MKPNLNSVPLYSRPISYTEDRKVNRSEYESLQSGSYDFDEFQYNDGDVL